MKKLMLALMLNGSVFALHAQLTEGQKALLEIEKQRTDAILSHNDAFLLNLYDDAYWGVAASGEVMHKAEQLLTFKNRNTFVVFSYDEIVATVYGNTAIVTGKQTTKSKTGSTLGQTRYLLVFSNLTNNWKIVTGQETDVIKK